MLRVSCFSFKTDLNKSYVENILSGAGTFKQEIPRHVNIASWLTNATLEMQFLMFLL